MPNLLEELRSIADQEESRLAPGMAPTPTPTPSYLPILGQDRTPGMPPSFAPSMTPIPTATATATTTAAPTASPPSFPTATTTPTAAPTAFPTASPTPIPQSQFVQNLQDIADEEEQVGFFENLANRFQRGAMGPLTSAVHLFNPEYAGYLRGAMEERLPVRKDWLGEIAGFVPETAGNVAWIAPGMVLGGIASLASAGIGLGVYGLSGAGDMKERIEAYEQRTGQKVGAGKRAFAIAGSGVINAGLEATGFHFLKSAAKKLTLSQAAKIGQALEEGKRPLLKTLLKSAGIEASEETGEAASDDALAGAMFEGWDAFKGLTSRYPREALGGAVGGVLLGAGGRAGERYREHAQLQSELKQGKNYLLTPQGTRDFAMQYPGIAQEIAGVEQPSRKEFEDWKFAGRWSQGERRQLADQLRQMIATYGLGIPGMEGTIPDITDETTTDETLPPLVQSALPDYHPLIDDGYARIREKKAEAEIERLSAAEVDDAEIARQLGLTENDVTYGKLRLGIPIRDLKKAQDIKGLPYLGEGNPRNPEFNAWQDQYRATHGTTDETPDETPTTPLDLSPEKYHEHGWKLNLITDAESAEAIGALLQERGIAHKVGQGENRRKIVINVGHRDTAGKLAQELREKFGEKIGQPTGEMKERQADFGGNIYGHFDIKGVDEEFQDYGFEGTPFTKKSMEGLVFVKGQKDQNKFNAKTLAEKILKERYGEFYAGKETAKPPAPPKLTKAQKFEKFKQEVEGLIAKGYTVIREKTLGKQQAVELIHEKDKSSYTYTGKERVEYLKQRLGKKETPPAGTILERLAKAHAAEKGKTERTRLADIRKHFPDMTDEQWQAELSRLHKEGKILLYVLDDPQEIKAADQAAAVEIAGLPHHLLMQVEPEGKTPEMPPTPPTPAMRTEYSSEEILQRAKILTASGWVPGVQDQPNVGDYVVFFSDSYHYHQGIVEAVRPKGQILLKGNKKAIYPEFRVDDLSQNARHFQKDETGKTTAPVAPVPVTPAPVTTKAETPAPAGQYAEAQLQAMSAKEVLAIAKKMGISLGSQKSKANAIKQILFAQVAVSELERIRTFKEKGGESNVPEQEKGRAQGKVGKASIPGKAPGPKAKVFSLLRAGIWKGIKFFTSREDLGEGEAQEIDVSRFYDPTSLEHNKMLWDTLVETLGLDAPDEMMTPEGFTENMIALSRESKDYSWEHIDGQLIFDAAREAGFRGVITRSKDHVRLAVFEGMEDTGQEIEGFQELGTEGGAGAYSAPFAQTSGPLTSPETQETEQTPKPTQNHPAAMVFSLSDLVQLAVDLTKGKFPNILKRLRLGRGTAAGGFYPKTGRIRLRADIFYGPEIMRGLAKKADADTVAQKVIQKILQTYPHLKAQDIRVIRDWDKKAGKVLLRFLAKDPTYAPKVLAHEIGHLVDWLPDKYSSRGNILGRIASLKKYLKTFLEAYPGGPAILHKKDRARLRRQAVKQAGDKATKEDIQKLYEQLRDAEIARRGLVSREEIMEELKALTQWWSPFDEDANPRYTAYRYSPEELYAEAISVLLNNPAGLQQQAPKFYNAFFAHLESKKEAKKIYEMISNEIRSGTNKQRLVTNTRQGMNRAEGQLVDQLDAQKRRKVEWIKALWQGFVDQFAVLKSKARKAWRSQQLSAQANPEWAIENAVYSETETKRYLSHLYYNVINKLEAYNLDWTDFNEYLFANRIIHERSDKANPWGWTEADAKARLKEIEMTRGPDALQALEEARQAFWKMRKEMVVDKAVAANAHDQELLDYMADNEYYATFLDIEKAIDDKFGKGTGLRIHRQIGTLSPIAGPATATVMKDLSLMKAINWNNAKRATVEMLLNLYPNEIEAAPKHWAGDRQVFDEPRDPNKKLILFLHQGKMQGYWVNAWVAKGFDKTDNPTLDAVVRILSAATNPFRKVFTSLRPGFQLFNALRDYMRTVANLPGSKAFNFFPYWLKAFGPAWHNAIGKPDAIIDAMQKNNMLLTWADPAGLENEDLVVERLLKSYLHHPKLWHQHIRNPLASLFHGLLKLGDMIEAIPKVGAYQYLKKNFPNMPEDEIAHLVRTQGGSPAFLNRGEAAPILNNLLLFSNAMIQGWRGDAEAFTNNKAEYAWKMAKYVFLPKAIQYSLASGALYQLYLLMGGDDDDDAAKYLKNIKDMYRNVSQYDMLNYIPIPLGLTPQGKTVLLRIPLNETQRFIGGLFYQSLGMPEQIYGDGIEFPEGLIDYGAGQLPNLHPAIKVGQAVMEYFSGRNPYDTFRGRNVIPETMWKAQTMETRKRFAQWISNELGGSLIYRFQSENLEDITNKELGFLAEFVDTANRLPFINDILGRFVKITDAGKAQALEEASAKAGREEARLAEQLRAIAKKEVKGEALTYQEAQLAEDEKDRLKYYQKSMKAQAGGTYARALFYAKSRAEKDVIQLEILRDEGKDVLLPLITQDIVSKANILTSLKPDEKEEIPEWEENVRKAGAWMKERRITQADILKAFAPELAKMKTPAGRAAKKRRLLKAINTLGAESRQM